MRAERESGFLIKVECKNNPTGSVIVKAPVGKVSI